MRNIDIILLKRGETMKRHCETCIYTTFPKEVITLHEKDVVFLEGTTITNAYMIKEGLVKVSKMTINGEEKIFDIFGPDEFLALVSILKQDDIYLATATCLTDVKLSVLDKQGVLDSYQSNNQFKDICIACAMTRTNLFQSHLFSSTNTDIEERILFTLEYLSKKFGKVINKEHTLQLPFSKTTLASIIGIRRETLSRKLATMQKDGLLDISKNEYKFYRE